MEVKTICRYNLPVGMVVFNKCIYRGTDLNPTSGPNLTLGSQALGDSVHQIKASGPDVAPTVFVADARCGGMMEAFGGIDTTTPDTLTRAMEETMDSGRPTLVNVVVNPVACSGSGSFNPQSVLKNQNDFIRLT